MCGVYMRLAQGISIACLCATDNTMLSCHGATRAECSPFLAWCVRVVSRYAQVIDQSRRVFCGTGSSRLLIPMCRTFVAESRLSSLDNEQKRQTHASSL
jgi:hypothetical protein